MICDGFMCLNLQGLGRFYDPVTDSTLTLCQDCFQLFKAARQRRGLPVPNVRKHDEDVQLGTIQKVRD